MVNPHSNKLLINCESILETIHEGIWIIDNEDIIIYANKAIANMLDVERKEILNKNVLNIFPENKVFMKHYLLTRKKMQSQKYEFGYITNKGRETYHSGWIVPMIDKGGLKGTICSIRDISKQKKIEDELIEINEKHQLAEDIAEYGHFIFKLNENKVSASAGARKIYGLTNDELTITQAQKIPLSKYRKILDESLENIIKYDKPYNVEFRIKRANDKNIRDIHSIARYDKENNLLIGIIRDITEQKEARRLLVESENRFRKIVEKNAVPIVLSDEKQDILLLNQKFTEFFGYTIEDISTASSWWEAAYPDKKYREKAKEEWNRAAEKAMREDTEIEAQIWEIACKNGEKKICEFSFVSLNTFNIISVHDITKLINIQRELTENREKLWLSLRASKHGIFEFDQPSGKIEISDSFMELLGFHPGTLMDMEDWNNHIYPDDLQRVSINYNNFLKVEKSFEDEFRFRKANGQYIWIWLKAEVFQRTQDKRPERIIGTLTDITQRKDYERKLTEKNQEIAAQNEEYAAINEELQTSIEEIKSINQDLEKAKKKAEESDKLKSAFLANMSHEIRTPMNSILGFSDLLSQKLISEEKRQKYSRLISSSSEQLMRLIDDIIDFSKIESGQLEIDKEQVSLKNLLEDVYFIQKRNKTFLNKSGVELRLVIHDNDIPVYIVSDYFRLNQILDNLVNNSAKFTDSGYIEIGAKMNKKKGQVIIYVKDTGIGISEENLSNIFERFYQADNHAHKMGTGLGLSISRGLVELMGGKMWVESELQKGTTVFFTIPVSEVEGNKKENTKVQYQRALPDLNTKLIYIAEDDLPSRIFIDEVLKDTSAVTQHAGNGKELLAMVKHKIPDLILVDINMPVMNGLEAVKEIRKINSDVPIIAQTAYAFSHEKESCLEAGCSEYIAKPIEKDELFSKIYKCLNI